MMIGFSVLSLNDLQSTCGRRAAGKSECAKALRFPEAAFAKRLV
jgi:hypothetical protein